MVGHDTVWVGVGIGKEVWDPVDSNIDLANR